MRDRVRNWTIRGTAVLAFTGLALLGAAWVAPRASGTASSWAAAPRVTTTTLDVSSGIEVAAPAFARAARSTVADGNEAAAATSVVIDAGASFTMIGVICDVPPAGAEIVVRLRTSLDGNAWSAWHETPLEVAAESGGIARAYTEALWTGQARYVEIAAQADADGAPRALTGVRVVALDTGGDGTLADAAAGAARGVVTTIAGPGSVELAAAAVETPIWVTRAGWGADESLRTGTPVTAPVKMAVVHHTAGGNEYTEAQAPALVRGIYTYHTTSLGWNDIGYNFLIDRFGTIYVGRAGGPGKGVVGAHTYGFNTGSTGISMMGTYTSETPSTAALSALERLLAWKLELHGVDPQGTVAMTCGGADRYKAGQTVTLPAVAGHRDANYTECPGDALYAWLPTGRAAAAALIKRATATPEPWAATLALSGARVDVGTTVTYKGSVKTASGAPGTGQVTVQKRSAAGGSWTDWRMATLSVKGAYSVAVKMVNERTWQFRARMEGDGANLTACSAVVDLRVGPSEPWAVTLALSSSQVKAGTTVVYRGSVKTAAGRAGSGQVTVQKRLATGGSWADWRTATLDTNGTYKVTVRMVNRRTWQFRTRMRGDGVNRVGYSALRRLTVK